MWYVLAFDTEQHEVTVVEMDADGSEEDMTYLSGRYTNLEPGDAFVFNDRDDAWDTAAEINDHLTSTIFSFVEANGSLLLMQKCTSCGLYFWTDWKEGNWFLSRNLKLPRKCASCRKKMRTRKEPVNTANDIYEAPRRKETE